MTLDVLSILYWIQYFHAFCKCNKVNMFKIADIYRRMGEIQENLSHERRQRKKLSSLKSCSTLQASAKAVSLLTPIYISKSASIVCRSNTSSARCLPASVSVMYPVLFIVMYPFSRRFFMATLTLGFVKFISFAISIERTCPLLFSHHIIFE